MAGDFKTVQTKKCRRLGLVIYDAKGPTKLKGNLAMNVGVINAFPMSLVTKRLTLNPEVPNEVLQEILHPQDWALNTEIVWLWGHKNTEPLATRFLHEQFGVVERWAAFGDRPTVQVDDDGVFFVTAKNGLVVEIDKLIILAPIFASNERKAEGQVAQASEVVGFRPILVETH